MIKEGNHCYQRRNKRERERERRNEPWRKVGESKGKKVIRVDRLMLYDGCSIDRTRRGEGKMERSKQQR